MLACFLTAQCPVYDLDNNVAFIGTYQTMTKKAAITVQVQLIGWDLCQSGPWNLTGPVSLPVIWDNMGISQPASVGLNGPSCLGF